MDGPYRRGISFIYTMHMHRILLNPHHLRVKLSEIMPAQAHSNYIQFRAVLHICEIPPSSNIGASVTLHFSCQYIFEGVAIPKHFPRMTDSRYRRRGKPTLPAAPMRILDMLMGFSMQKGFCW